MEPKFQSSFIPKRPTSDPIKEYGPVHKNSNIFSIIATILFLLAFFSSVGLFVYQKIIEQQITSASTELKEAETAFDIDKIQELISAGARIQSIHGLLDKHVAMSEILVLLQNLTVKTIKFDNLTISNESGSPSISMNGESLTYNAIARQSEIFKSNSFLTSVAFSDFSLDDKGLVKFRFSGRLSPNLLSYREAVRESIKEE